MCNLLRMDIYQLSKSKMFKRSVLGLGIFALIFAFFFIACVDEEINAWFLKRGIIFSINFKQEITMSLLGIYQTFLSSGFFIGVILMVYGSILHSEYQDGFIKNIGTAYIDKKSYACSKLAKAGIMNLVYLIITTIPFFIVCLLFPKVLQLDTLIDMLGFFAVNWLMITGICSFVFLLMMWFRNKSLIIIYAVLLASSIITMLQGLILSIFHLEHWMEYDLYYRLLDCPIMLQGESYLFITALSVGVIAVCTTLGYMAFMKKDIV